ncbi:MAG: cobamide remodeling phosphodiesterase CbiR [Candidatus Heimdallarchaeaceae archaeon]
MRKELTNMALLFGARPFEFSDFFALFQNGQFDLTKLDYVKIVKKYTDAGYKHIELTGDLIYVLPGIITPDVIKKLIALKEEKNVTYSVHLPLWGVEPAAFAPKIRKAAVETFIECIEFTKPLNPLCWVIHPTGALTVEFMQMKLLDDARSLMIQQFTGYAADAINQVIKTTEIPSQKIAVENIEYPFELMYQVVEKLNLSICFDTGHLLAGYSGKMGVIDFIKTYFDRIIELHLHDGKYPRIDHRTLGEYDLPVRELLLLLLKKKFAGPLVYELSFDEAQKSMEYIKRYFPEVL